MNFFTPDIIEQIRKGFYSAVYFNRTQNVLLREHNLKTVTMQIFQKQDNQIVCGIDEVVELFRNCTGFFENGMWVNKFSELTVETMKDGQKADAWETVMHVTGPYAYFAHLESMYLGILARRTKVATGVRNVVTAAGEKPIIFFADRFDYFANQPGDGYAAKIGGVTGVATDAQASWFGEKGIGTIPHALIAVNNGDTIAAAEQFSKYYPEIPLIVLVDFENDCVKTSLEVARALGDKLYGVRLDTSEKLIDKSLQDQEAQGVAGQEGLPGARTEQREGALTGGKVLTGPRISAEDKHGVNPQLVKNVRNALASEGFRKVKIVVSGGFNEEKIRLFEQEQTPVDMYGVGSSLLRGHAEFTADIVKVDGKEIAKFGRKFQPGKKLQVIA